MSLDLREHRLVKWGAVLPLAMNFVFIAFFTNAMLAGDEWDLISNFFLPVRSSGFDWTYFWLPHNEHRMVTLKLIQYVFGFFSLDPRWLMVLSSLVWWLTLCELNRVVRFEPQIESRLKIILSILAAFFFFSAIQSENFFWGIQLSCFIATFGIVGALTSAIERRYLRTSIFTALAYFSFAIWPALVPPLFSAFLLDWWKSPRNLRIRRLIPLIALVILSAAALAIYTYDLPQPPGHDKLALNPLTAPFKYFMYVVMQMGVPFGSMGFYVSLPMGLLAVGLPIWLLRKKPELLSRFDLALWLYTLSMAGMIGLGRASMWKWHDVAPLRYSTMYMPLWFALAALFVRWGGGNRRTLTAIASILALNIWVADSKGFDHEKGAFETRAKQNECLSRLLASNTINRASPDYECIKGLYHNPELLLDTTRRLHDWQKAEAVEE